MGRVTSTQLPTSLPMKPIMTTSITISNAPSINVDLSKTQTNKGLNINGGGSSSATTKPITSAPKDKGKGINMELSKEENKKL